jgi:hypothetical protein
MSSFDPMAAAIDWLDTYRAASLSIVDLYADDAALECGCDGQKVLYGRKAITEYWRQRFLEKPAGELVDLRMDASEIVVTYKAAEGVVEASLRFDDAGRIARSDCGPIAKVLQLRR